MNRIARVTLGTATLLVALTVMATDTLIDAGKSKVIATFKQEGVPVDAPFLKFSGKIVYDPATVASASASLEVETGSLDIGSEDYNAEVRKKEWFDSAGFPKATFRSTAIKPVAQGRFDATGTLSIKGRSKTVTVPITIQNGNSGNVFSGSFVLSRAAFGIGDPAWNDVLEDKVTVRFQLTGA